MESNWRLNLPKYGMGGMRDTFQFVYREYRLIAPLVAAPTFLIVGFGVPVPGPLVPCVRSLNTATSDFRLFGLSTAKTSTHFPYGLNVQLDH